MQQKEYDSMEELFTKEEKAPLKNGNSKLLKKELLEVFQKHGYLSGTSDCEIKVKITSGNIAWISINSIETIK